MSKQKDHPNFPSETCLVVTFTDSAPVAFPIKTDSVLIGRNNTCDIFLCDRSISREHAQITVKDGVYWIEDLNSLNGTILNGGKLKERKQLFVGDKIVFGQVPTVFDQELEGSKTLTNAMPWEQVDEAGRLVPETKAGSNLSFIMEVTEALDNLGDQDLLLSRFAKILCTYFSSRLVCFRLFEKNSTSTPPSRWFDNEKEVSAKDNDKLIDKFAEKMALEGNSFVTQIQSGPSGKSAVMYVPISTDAGIIGSFACAGDSFDDGALRMGSVVARILGLALSKYGNVRFVLAEKGVGPVWIGESKGSKRVLSQVAKYALGEAPVCIFGKSGTGKELVAAMMHQLSSRNQGPFVAFNCAAVPANLAEDELFGHVRGAFSGADKDRKGLFEQGHQGVVFLDEISEMSLEIQAKLLRVLEEKKVRPIGSDQLKNCDFRVVCASNMDLVDLVNEGKFRSDLLYRLNILRIDIPSLKERASDIPLLAEHFLEKIAQRDHRKLSLTEKAMEALCHYSWPGNIRQLQGVIERSSYIASNHIIDVSDLELFESATSADSKNSFGSLSKTLEKVEKEQIYKALMRYDWNKSKTASVLGITRQTLDRKINQYRLSKNMNS